MKKKLSNILFNCPNIIKVQGDTNIVISGLHFDSRKIKENFVFVALEGTQVDGHQFIQHAINNGASVIVCQKQPQIYDQQITVIIVKDSHLALASLAANYYGHPSKELNLIGITGTNGKTTIATSLYRLFEKLGYKSGLISTITNLMHNFEWLATHTTPDPITINMLLEKMVKEHFCTYAFMEVSSHALEQRRTCFLDFNGAIFTNITHDHLDYHLTFKNYLYAKKKLFDNLSSHAFALVNGDDKNHKVIVQNTKAKVYTFALKNMADFRARILEKHFDGTLAIIDNREIWLNLIGEFNVYNLLAVYATAVLLGINKEKALEALSALPPVDGRFEIISKQGLTAIVDYAHTPDALKKILTELNKIRQPKQRIITVLGAGGNRDKDKRPKMGQIASSLSNILIITSDNPRNEDPQEIINQIEQGIDSENCTVLKIIERREAIHWALTIARKGDIVLVAGKGHETYQEINGIKFYFDDRQIIKDFLNIKN